MKKRVTAILLVLIMVLSFSACTSTKGSTAPSTTASAQATSAEATSDTASKYPSYLNLGSMLPVIKEGEVQPTLTMAIKRRESAGEFNNLWAAKYIKKYMNLSLTVEEIDSAALAERKTLMFASGDLPDIMMDLEMSAGDMITYGQVNHQLLPMDTYINSELTPNMDYWFTQDKTIEALAKTPDGHMYTLPKVLTTDNEGDVARLFVNTKWLDACGLKSPTTLDDFLTMLKTFKEKDPAGVGAKNIVPLGGGLDKQEPGYFILNSMGYIGGNGYGLGISVRNGEAEFPCGNAELFKEYLKIMKDLYDQGLVSKNFFVQDDTECNAQVTSGYVGTTRETVYATGIKTFGDWWAISPLTSKWNDKPVCTTPSAAGIGGFSISANTKVPELCLRFADEFFSKDYFSRMLWIGPKDGSEEALGYLGNTSSDTGNEGWAIDEKKFPNGITDLWTYLVGYISFYAEFGTNDSRVTISSYAKDYLGGKAPSFRQFDLTNPDQQYRASVVEKVMPYCTTSFPNVWYLDEEKTNKLADYSAVIEPFVKQQVAMFINGDRSLDEFSNFISELDKLGFQDYQKIYKDIWANYKANMK